MSQKNERDESLYYYQEEYKQKVYKAWYEDGVKRVMLQMPTATGKTRVSHNKNGVIILDNVRLYNRFGLLRGSGGDNRGV
jgi:hypothetical protein